MTTSSGNNIVAKTTIDKVVVPFYAYAALSFFVAALFLFISADSFTTHYFSPSVLAITHAMALGWGTMIIVGASHQLIPVLIESELYSYRLAYASFFFLALGIPLLVYAFYNFNMGWPARCGGIFIVTAVVVFLINIGMSMSSIKKSNIHAVFVFTAALWLLFTTLFGLTLVFNFTTPLLKTDSLKYLSLHAHVGVVGWFLLLILGVASRLIPMFLISKYTNDRLLLWVYILINVSLLGFIFIFLFSENKTVLILPVFSILFALALFGLFIFRSYRERIRKQVDEQMKLSLLSVVMLVLPVVFLFVIIGILVSGNTEQPSVILTYGFLVFFGWITAIILGMTFKTLPFIVWNKIYHHHSGAGKVPAPKDMFNDRIFILMSLIYIAGFIAFTIGILMKELLLLKTGSFFLILTSVLYSWNVLKILYHKPSLNDSNK